MTTKLKHTIITVSLGSFLSLTALTANGAVSVQCPGDTDGDAMWASAGEVRPTPNTKCLHLGAGDGFVTMADGKSQYMFGFSDLTGIPTVPAPATPDDAMSQGLLAANFPAPPIVLEEGDELYLTLTNVGMAIRPDLFDPHTLHYHGFPEAAPIFDGVPDASISINMGSSLTYFYKVNDPGTYMYHCHVEASEHMQMGMLGNLYVKPAQNQSTNGADLNGFTHQTGFEYAYNDGDGSTYYDVDYPIQIGSFDSAFHDASRDVQPLPFAYMNDDYPMLNGRGYPDTVVAGSLPAPPTDPSIGDSPNGGVPSQQESALITAQPGQKVLLRISNLNVTRFYTLGTMGLPMTIIGKDARLLRGPGLSGKNLYYQTNSVTLGGGESVDAIVDIPVTASPGDRYFLYTTNLNYLRNNTEDEAFGGMMTEIRVIPTPPI